MRFLSTVLGSSPVYRFLMQRNPIKCGVPLFFVSKILWTDADSINVLLLFRFWLTGTRLKKYLPVIVASASGFFFSVLASPYLHWAVSLECILPERWSEPPAHS